MRHIDVDWEREFEQHEIDDYCPFCEGTSIKDHYKLDKDEAKKLEDFRNDYDELEKRDAYCDECESGYIRPMMNYKYPISLFSMELSDARRKACELGLFLYEDEEEQAWIALMGGGMDLSPSILLTYLEIEKSIPLEWATEFQQDYRANISEENHKRIAKACYDTISRNITQLGTKLDALNMFIHHNKKMKKKLAKQMNDFNKALDSASDTKEPAIRAMIAFSAFSKATKEITE